MVSVLTLEVAVLSFSIIKGQLIKIIIGTQ